LPLFGRDAAPLFVLAMDSDLLLALDSESPLAVASLSPDSMVIAPESVALDLHVELQDSVPPESEVAPKDDSSLLDSKMVPESLEFVLDSMAPESEHALPPGTLFALAVISSMRTAKRGIVHTRVSSHALAVVSCTWNTCSSPCFTALTSSIARFSSPIWTKS
jgi:hypothetical protein